MYKMDGKLSLLALILMSFISSQVSAFTQKEMFNQGIQFASASKDKPVNALKGFKPETAIKNYNAQPPEVKYEVSPDSIKTSANQQINSDIVGKSLLEGAANRQEKFSYSKDPNSKEITQILQKKDDIYDVVTGQFGDCTKKTNCTMTYVTKKCEESPAGTWQYCAQTLNIDMIPKKYETHFPLTIHITSDDHYYAGAKINPINGHVEWAGPKDASVKLTGRIPGNIDCKSLQGTISNVHSKNPATNIDSIDYPSCQNGLQLGIHVINTSKRGQVNIDIQLDISSTKIVPEPYDRWIDGCEGLAKISSCSIKEERCIEANTTHDVSETPVTRACWRKEITYQCGNLYNVQSCQPLKEQGCEQTSSICKNKGSGGCSLYEQTFQCPLKQCTDVGLVCNGQTYCLDGDCVKQQTQSDPDFQRSISALSVANEAAKSFTNFNAIFTGQKKTCDKVFLGFIDCCADEGWGKDIHLAQCSPEEKELGKSKENLQTIYLGEYCKKNALGVCIEYRKAYCVFSSKLARIIQDQGRRNQLGIGFGDPENADCKGLTREQFASLNLSKMDFSDFYTEISEKQHIENSNSVIKRLNEKVQNQKGRKANDQLSSS